jgi:hypothetical protein
MAIVQKGCAMDDLAVIVGSGDLDCSTGRGTEVIKSDTSERGW